jgi:hypothetical protein
MKIFHKIAIEYQYIPNHRRRTRSLMSFLTSRIDSVISLAYFHTIDTGIDATLCDEVKEGETGGTHNRKAQIS